MGEILLGIKWSPVSDDSTSEKLDGPSNGQLQVYVVEGAGMVDEETHKPFNAFIKWYVVATPTSCSCHGNIIVYKFYMVTLYHLLILCLYNPQLSTDFVMM